MNTTADNLSSQSQNSAIASARDLTGFLLIDKPLRITSHDVLQALRRITGIKKLGHTGTLDPLATGLMVCCAGSASKLARFLVSKDKTYEATIRLGMSTETYDSEGMLDNLDSASVPNIDLKKIESVLELFVGNIQQRAPKYSAIKVNGKALYKSARKGESCDPPIRSVVINSIKITDYQPPFLRLTVACGKGTYIRSLAHDIGAELGFGAYLSALRRTMVGDLKLEDAYTLDDIQLLTETDRLSTALVKAESVIDLPSLIVDDNFADRVRQGALPKTSDIASIQGTFCAGNHVFLKNNQGQALAVGICEISSEELPTWRGDRFYHYERVL